LLKSLHLRRARAQTLVFLDTFWRADRQYLADVVNEHGPDLAIRPNQIFAASLPYSPLSLAQRRAVVACVEQHLVTPCGLRSLAPDDPAYCARYQGGSTERDRAYHQGTVWAWLVGHFVQAALAVTERPAARRAELKARFAPLFHGELAGGCVGGVPEIFDGSPPHTAQGCFSQAWSVAEVIRAWELLKRKADRP
jgi:glycogen debranching enzyme